MYELRYPIYLGFLLNWGLFSFVQSYLSAPGILPLQEVTEDQAFRALLVGLGTEAALLHRFPLTLVLHLRETLVGILLPGVGAGLHSDARVELAFLFEGSIELVCRQDIRTE